MKQHVFEATNATRWQAFEDVVALLDRKRWRPGDEDRSAVAGFPDLYREICRDLAVATERRYGPRLLDRLNRMSLDGHRLLYAREGHFSARLIRFVAQDFPRRLRAEARILAIATALFLVPAILIGSLIHMFPELVFSVMGPEEVRQFESMYDPGSAHVGSERGSADDFAMFGYYVFNNIGIAFRAYAGGLILGLGSAVILVLNGVLLGAVAGHIGHLGFEETFYSFVIGHGAFELTAIVISGAAGLRLGLSILAPGARSRIEALRVAARESLVLVYGVFGMLLLAAVIEAFWSSKGSVPSEMKFVVGALCWAVVFAYLGLVGRGRDRSDRMER